MQLSIAILFVSVLLCYANNYDMDYKWNPLQFPNTKIYTILTFDDISWNQIINETENEELNHICDIICECWYDAFGYTLTTETRPTTSISIPDITHLLLNYDTESSSSSSRRLLSDSSESKEEYDALLNGVISFKNIKKSLLSHNRLNYTFGVLFNDIDIYNQFKSISMDSIDHNYELLRGIFHECLFLTLNIKHIELHTMSISQGMYDSNTDSDTDFVVDLLQTPTPTSTSRQYKVMITLNGRCLISSIGETKVGDIIDDIITFYGDCLYDDSDTYKTYHVSDIDIVYFFNIIDNDKGCLIKIDMEYLSSKCIDMVEYEPIYSLDTDVDCSALDIAALHLWNLDFFDGNPDDATYHILDNHHLDHGVDQYILDTGILSSHEIFTNNEILTHETIHFVPSHYHGTYVAGIAGGNIYGTSRNLTIYDYQVCEGSSCSYSKVLDGIEAAKLNMISTGRRGVINLSFGGAISATNTVSREKWDFIMKGIIDAGGIPVCSAGNTQLNGCNYVPGQSKYCISVGAFDVFGDLYSRTNYGECVNIFAPGVSIKSAGSSTTNQYIIRSGTSAAAPHITGLISNLLWIKPTLTFDHILYIIDNNKQYLDKCPNNYTKGTRCPYISLECDSFQDAIHTAILHVPIELFPSNNNIIIIDETTTKRPTISPTNTPTISTANTPTTHPINTLSSTDATVIPPTSTPTNAITNNPTERYKGLKLAGFNNGFTVDFSKITNDDDESSVLYHNDIHNDIHNDALFYAFYTSLILPFSHVLFVLYLI